MPESVKSDLENLKQAPFELNAGESKEQTLIITKTFDIATDSDSEKTGDNSLTVICVAVMIFSAGALLIIAVKSKKFTKMGVTALILCAVLLNATVVPTVAGATGTVKDFTVENTFKWNGEDVTFKVKISYLQEKYCKVTVNGEEFFIPVGEKAEFTAPEAEEGKQFDGWTVVNGNVTLDDGKKPTVSFTAPEGEVELKAKYAPITYTVTVTSGDNGKVTPAGNVKVEYGKNQTFKIEANEGYHVKQVEVDGENKGAITSYTFENVKENHTVKAYFEIDTFTITSGVNNTVMGSVTETASVNYGGEKTFVITPNDGYYIFEVQVDGVVRKNMTSYTFTDVKENHEIYVTFAKYQYSITVTANEGGKVTGIPYANSGKNTTLNITANSGYGIKDVKVDGVSIGSVNAYTFENVKENHTFEVAFDKTVTVMDDTGLRSAVAQGGIIILANDITLEDKGQLEITEDVTIIGGDYKIKNANYTHQGENYTHSYTAMLVVNAGGHLRIYSGKFQNIFFGNGSEGDFYGGEYEENVSAFYGSQLRIYGGSYTSVSALNETSKMPLTVYGGTFKASAKSGFNESVSYSTAKSFDLKGGTYYFDPTSYTETDNCAVTQTKDGVGTDIWVISEK